MSVAACVFVKAKQRKVVSVYVVGFFHQFEFVITVFMTSNSF